jgi:hypothetical protein
MSLLRAHCGAIVERGAPATAIHVRDIVKQIYGFAILHGEKVANPADAMPANGARRPPRINLQAARRRSLGEHPKRSVNALVKAAADR